MKLKGNANMKKIKATEQKKQKNKQGTEKPH